MKVSLNAIKKYVDVDISTEELVKLIGSRLVEIEGTVDLSEKYKGITIVKIVECEPIPETHLSLCQIDNGKEKVQVVCGAPNVKQGMLAAWLAPGCIVPATFGGENFKLDVRELRGYKSNGMLAALDELDLGTDHAGIIEINPDDAKPGDDFAKVFDLNDVILDIENKSLTHRPDCFGIIGFAREVAGILGKKFVEPDFLTHEEVFPEGFLEENDQNGVSSKNCSIKIDIENPELCPRYSCAVVEINSDDLKDKKYLTKGDIFLAKADMHGISNIVDISNILMLETGQPLHTFDYDKFIAVGGTSSPEIGVRLAKEGEKLELLDGKTIECTVDDILITSNDVPVALAGAMGGANTEIDGNTKKVLIESASFSLYNLRKTQMHHGIFSEAITRFTKGVPAGNTFNVMAEAVKELGGKATEVCDNFIGWKKAEPIYVSVSDINSLLGTNYDAELIIKTLDNVGISCKKTSESDFEVLAPCWRTDLHIKEDIIEEVGRLLGYDNIAIDFPKRPFIGAEISPMLSLKTKIRNILSDKLNANEVLTYSFISEKLMNAVNQKIESSYKIVNSISPELQCFRQHIAPSLIDKVRENIKAGHENFVLYELNQVSGKDFGLDEDKSPITEDHLATLSFGDFYQIKNIVKKLADNLNINISIKEFEHQEGFPYLEPLHSADVYIKNEYIGSIGEVKQSILNRFKLNDKISITEINLAKLLGQEKLDTKKLKVNKFPFVYRDVTAKVNNDKNFADLHSAIENVLKQENLIYKIAPSSIYRPEENSDFRNISFHIAFSNSEKTLQPNEISAIMEQINKALQALGVEVV